MCATTERAELLLPVSTRSPAEARKFLVASGCADHATHVLDEALLLVTELVTNSVLHGGPTIMLSIECDGTGLCVRVRDGSEVMPRPRDAGDDDEGGRGLTLVDLLTDKWGVEHVDDELGVGKAVWFELRRHG